MFESPSRRFLLQGACACAVFASLGLALPSEAGPRKAADALKGKIVLALSSFPPNFKSEGAIIKHMKKVGVKELYPEKEGGDWSFHYMAFFAKPLERKRHVVLFFDVTDRRQPIFLLEAESFPSTKGQRIMVGDYKLPPPQFQENKKILMTYAEAKNRKPLAEAFFVLKGFNEKKAEKLKALRADEEKRKKEDLARRKKEREKGKSLKWEPPNW